MPRFPKGSIPSPINNNPLIKRLVDLMNETEIDSYEVCRQAGVSTASIHAWRTKSHPNITNLEAVLNVLGYKLAIVRLDDV